MSFDIDKIICYMGAFILVITSGYISILFMGNWQNGLAILTTIGVVYIALRMK